VSQLRQRVPANPFVCQMVYPAIIQSAFGLFTCTELADGSRALSMAPHLDCDSDDSRFAQAVATSSLAIWGVGFPIFLGLLIKRKASDQRYSFIIVSYGYKSNLRHWEAWECMKKFGILLIITFLNFRSGTGCDRSASLPVLRTYHKCRGQALHQLSHQRGSSCLRLPHLLCAPYWVGVDRFWYVARRG
jgi:hypothetical protein